MFFAREGLALDAPSAPATAQSRGSVGRAGTCCRARQVAGAAHPDQRGGDWADAWLERIVVLYRAHRALVSATAPGTDAYEDAGRWQRAFADIDAHRVLQASDARKGLLHPAAAKVIATLTCEWPGLGCHQELPQLRLDNNTAQRAADPGDRPQETSTAPAPNRQRTRPLTSGRSPRPPPGTAPSRSAC